MLPSLPNMKQPPDPADIPLPKTWPEHARSAVLHVVALAHVAIIGARGRTSRSEDSRDHLRGKLDNARAEIAMLKEELRIKDARMAHLEPRRRPHYRPTDRMAILELRAARAWSAAETARRLLVQPATIASWLKRADDGGESALVQTPEPVNKFPAFVRHIVCRLKALNPTMGKKRIAQALARAGIHLGTTTVSRMLEEGRASPTDPEDQAPEENATDHAEAAEAASADAAKRPENPVKSEYVHHVWLTDLTVVPISGGFWTPWIPHALAQTWPFCWWVACVIDHYSRRVVGFAVFGKQPTSVEMRAFLGRAIANVRQSPKYLVTDQGGQFDCDGYRDWCTRKGILYRYGSVGSHAATAVVERFWLSLKEELLRRGPVPLWKGELRSLLVSYLTWFHDFRPHQGLDGRTPREVYFGLKPANERPRIEPRPNWPRRSPCARPLARIRVRGNGQPDLVVRLHDRDARLPIVELKPAA